MSRRKSRWQPLAAVNNRSVQHLFDCSTALVAAAAVYHINAAAAATDGTVISIAYPLYKLPLPQCCKRVHVTAAAEAS
jgi:hypothetical protein